MQRKAVTVLAAAVVAVALIAAMPANAAGNAGSTQVTTFDPKSSFSFDFGNCQQPQD
jgi:hypothetical protein